MKSFFYRSIPDMERLITSLNCFVTILVSIDWDLDDLAYLDSNNLNLVEYLIENCSRFMPITSSLPAVLGDTEHYQTPTDLLEDLFSLSRHRFHEVVAKKASPPATEGAGDSTKLAMLKEVDEEDDESESGSERSDRSIKRASSERPLLDSESFDLNLFPRMYHQVFSSSTGSASTKFDTDSLIKCLTNDIKVYDQYEKYIVARYMFWKYFSKLKTNFYCDSCSIILTSNRLVYLTLV